MDDLVSIIRLLQEAPGPMGVTDNAAASDGHIKVLLVKRGPTMIVGNLIVPEDDHQVFCVRRSGTPRRSEELAAAGSTSPAHDDCVDTHVCVVYKPFGIDTVCVRFWPLQANEAANGAA
ncbi:MAG: hypothetical protein ACYS8X_08270 [Planctomycetota bacterium]|jgi:hypothetical protein